MYDVDPPCFELGQGDAERPPARIRAIALIRSSPPVALSPWRHRSRPDRTTRWPSGRPLSLFRRRAPRDRKGERLSENDLAMSAAHKGVACLRARSSRSGARPAVRGMPPSAFPLSLSGGHKESARSGNFPTASRRSDDGRPRSRAVQQGLSVGAAEPMLHMQRVEFAQLGWRPIRRRRRLSRRSSRRQGNHGTRVGGRRSGLVCARRAIRVAWVRHPADA
jgi:hypothetical protein